jgi:4-amino-4-deoxy-L-arabinose transferase-like glycosyltransferase
MFRPARILSLLLVLAAALFVSRTWPVLSHTWDEPAHLAAGMEWLDRGTFETEELTPPLARVLGALGPYLAGARFSGSRNFWVEGNAILATHGEYRRNLVLARLGLLPLLFLGAWAVWSWARRIAGEGAGLAAVAAFVGLPVVMGHAGLAATDFALCACWAASLEAFDRWIGKPSAARAAWLGAAVALAVLSKFSAIPFLGLAFVLIAVLRYALHRADDPSPTFGALARTAAMLVLALALVLWGGYRFRIDPLAAPDPSPHAGLQGAMMRALEADVWPARSLWKGLAQIPARNAMSHKSYFAGEAYRGTRPAFFPVALGLRTPIPFLLLLAAAPLVLLLDRERRGRWRTWAPLLASLAVLAVAMTGKLNLGLRLALPAYAGLAVFVGVACASLWSRGAVARALVVIALAAQGAMLVRAFPEPLAYFNAFAGRDPGRWLVDSDLDWGQGWLMLADTLRARGVDSVAIAIPTMADLSVFGLPPHRTLAPADRATGWIAVSEYGLHLGPARAAPESAGVYRWIEQGTLVSRVGRSMRLYRYPAVP